LLLLKKVTESLAGRIGLLTLLPFQYSEIPEEMREASIFQGSFPEMVARKYEFWQEWYSADIETYLQRDLRQLSNIGDLHDFTRFLTLLAARTAQLLNLST
jgi:predicted AAA+ superfamily ATPase